MVERKRSVAMTGLWEVGAAMCAALASLDFFGSVFYQKTERSFVKQSDHEIIKRRNTSVVGSIERPVGEAKE